MPSLACGASVGSIAPHPCIEGNRRPGNSRTRLNFSSRRFVYGQAACANKTLNRVSGRFGLAFADLSEHRQNEIRSKEARARFAARNQRHHRAAVRTRDHRAIARRKRSRNRRNGDVESAYKLELFMRELGEMRYGTDFGY